MKSHDVVERPISALRFAAWARRAVPASLIFSGELGQPFNDRYGHQAGDEALKAVAEVLSRFARRPLDLAARYGGEEFAVILFDAKRGDAERIAGDILEAVRRHGIVHQDSAAAPVLTISIGIACVQPAARRSWSGLVQLADQALYAAKDGGRNRAVALEREYEHMQTGYFRRAKATQEPPVGDQ